MATPPEMRTTSPPSPDFEGGSDTPGDGAGLLLLPSGAAWGEAAGGTVSPADVVLWAEGVGRGAVEGGGDGATPPPPPASGDEAGSVAMPWGMPMGRDPAAPGNMPPRPGAGKAPPPGIMLKPGMPAADTMPGGTPMPASSGRGRDPAPMKKPGICMPG